MENSDEIKRRIESLEHSYSEIRKDMHELTMQVKLTSHSVQSLAESIAHQREAIKAVDILDKRLIKVETGYGAIKIIGSGSVLAIIGLATTAIFGGNV